MLKLTAEVLWRDGDDAEVRVEANGTAIGILEPSAKHAVELVGLLSAATELLHACKFMWRQAVMEGRGCSGDPNKPEYDRAKAAIDIAELNTQGGTDANAG